MITYIDQKKQKTKVKTYYNENDKNYGTTKKENRKYIEYQIQEMSFILFHLKRQLLPKNLQKSIIDI